MSRSPGGIAMAWRTLLMVSVAAFASLPAQGAGLFGRRQNQPAAAKPNTDDKTVQLIRLLRTDGDERRRTLAVENLARFDLKQHPQAGFALIEAMSRDSSAMVRRAAAESLGKMRPMTQQVAQALEQVSIADSASEVRASASQALQAFVEAGYKPMKRGEAPAATAAGKAPRPQPLPSRLLLPNETTEPPLAEVNSAKPTETAKVAVPAPARPSTTTPNIPRVNPPLTTEEPKTAVPSVKPVFPKKTSPTPEKPTPAKPNDEGPILIPPE
jgi:hypothetical protein